MTRSILLYAAFFAGLLASCSVEVKVKHPPVPVANDQNCADASIRRIEDEEVRQKLASACFRRGLDEDYEPQPGKGWKP
jgi:entry exclusion lipoprotein TrbK